MDHDGDKVDLKESAADDVDSVCSEGKMRVAGRDSVEKAGMVDGSADEERYKDAGSRKKCRRVYTREKLHELADSYCAHQRPKCLSPEFTTPEGYWDPEMWVRSFHSSRGSSPLTAGGRDRKRPLDMEKELMLKRRSSDPRVRIREEEEDSLGIVLSPQRKSFGTGCHVASSAAHRRSGSPVDSDRDRDRRVERRIGSGRIQIDREGHREIRDFRERDRDPRDFRDARGRFDRDDRRYDRYGRRDDRREFGGRFSRNRRESYRHEEEEPEWFTEGPTSQTDTIELRGFEREGSHAEKSQEREITKAEEKIQEEPMQEEQEVQAAKVNVVDRNGSVETNDSSSPEAPSPQPPPHKHHLHHQQQALHKGPTSNEFDLNDFFKIENIENIPGLAEGLVVEEPGATASSSRFSHWFSAAAQGAGANSSSNSRRSSLNDEFGYLHDLVSGQKSPVVPSPTPPSVGEQQRMLFDGMLGPEMVHQANLLEMMHNARMHHAMVQPGQRVPINHQGNQIAHQTPANLMEMMNQARMHHSRSPPAISIPLNPNGAPPTASEVEADLKALLLSGNHKGSIDPKSITPLTVPPSGQVRTVAELEASLKDMVLNNNNKVKQDAVPGHRHSPVQQEGPKPATGNMDAFNKLLEKMKASGALSETPKMPQKNDNRPISPVKVSLTPQQQKNVLQELVRMQQKQAQTQHHKQQQLQQQLREQQAKMQQQQQHHLQDRLLTALKPPSSPIPPQMATLQPPTSPRGPSPNVIQQSLLQQPPSPRAPSPIMFGSQPPVHLAAPSPIHPGQLPQTSQNTLSVNSIQGVTSPIARVPSPQELIVHTQAIMQNALLKKQLEDQKERFLKKQQESCHYSRGKSPIMNTTQNVKLTTAGPTLSIPGAPLLHQSLPQPMQVPQPVPQPQQKTALPAAFMPTSVMKKIASDKLEERERQAKTDTPPAGAISSDDKKGHSDQDVLDAQDMETESRHTLSETSSVESITLTVPQLPLRPQPIKPQDLPLEFANVPQTGAPQSMAPPVAMTTGSLGSIPMQIPTSLLQGGVAKGLDSQGRPARPLVGQGTMNFTIPIQVSTVSGPSTSAGGRPIVKGIQPMLSPGATMASQRTPGVGGQIKQEGHGQRPIMGNQQAQPNVNQILDQQRMHQRVAPPSPNLPRANATGIPITGRMPMQPGVVKQPPVPGVNPAASALLMQRLMQPGLAAQAAARGPTPPVNLSQLNQLAALQHAQQRMLDARLQGASRTVYPPGASPMLAGAAQSRVGLSVPPVAMSRALSPQPQLAQSIFALAKQGEMMGPLSPGLQHGQLNMKTGGTEANLVKWFGSDVLKQQLPQLPTQNQKVLTVDEIERH